MRKLFVLILVFVLAGVFAPVHAEKIKTLKELYKPFIMAMDDQNMFVSQGHEIYIFTLKDFKFVKKFGKLGDGPQEMRAIPTMGVFFFPQKKDEIIVNSVGKILSFTKSGKFNYEKSIRDVFSGGITMHQPLGDGYAGFGVKFVKEKNKLYHTFNIYDKDIKVVKELGSKASMSFTSMELPQEPPQVLVVDSLIYTPGGDGKSIKVYDSKGTLLRTIAIDVKPIKVTEAFKKDSMEFYKRIIPGGQFEAMKRIMKWKEYFPTYQNYTVKSGKLYVLTYAQEKGKAQFMIYNEKGKFEKSIMVPFSYTDGILPAPFDFMDGKFYQLVDNVDDETIELHAYPIK